MTQIVEARSLGLLTTLASDPPLYPYNPTHESHGPLALYIVRVPGSKDVFLTPLKPRDKVVNAQDVQSSLYYLHVDEPSDVELIPAEENHYYSSPVNSAQSQLDKSQIARKPLPTPPMSPIDTCDFPFRQQKPYSVAGMPKRKPLVNSDQHLSTGTRLELPQIPPRPSYRSSRSFEDSARPGTYGSLRPLPEPPERGQIASHPTIYDSESLLYDRSSPKPETTRSVPDDRISLTLIRRDPTSGAQWNVAKIYDPPVEEISSESVADGGVYRSKRSGAPLFVDINNPGYSKFLQLDNLRPGSRHSTESSSMEFDSQPDGVFRRRVWMDGSKFADHAYTQKKHFSVDGTRISRKSLQLSAQDFKISPRAMVDRRSKGYSFRSPWGGKCEFATGLSGRSLKCKHHPDGSSGGHAAEVSELRFNLPTSGASLGATSSHTATERSSKRASLMPRLPSHKHTPSDDFWDAEMPDELPNYFDENGNIDLTLGQERAGGGFHGKRAKLGKLIVDDMGMRMLDLTVAANMALWWRAYERA